MFRCWIEIDHVDRSPNGLGMFHHWTAVGRFSRASRTLQSSVIVDFIGRLPGHVTRTSWAYRGMEQMNMILKKPEKKGFRVMEELADV